jgi:hypothetical protein
MYILNKLNLSKWQTQKKLQKTKTQSLLYK